MSMKNSYMTGILRSAKLVLEADSIEYKTVEDYVFAQIQRFIGKKQLDIFEKVTNKKLIGKIPKHLSKMISNELIGKDEELPQKNPLFQKVNYVIKNLPVNKFGYPIERMSFRNLVLSEFKDDWEDSFWKNYFEEVTIIVICYRGDRGSKNGERILEVKNLSKSFGTSKILNNINFELYSGDVVGLIGPNGCGKTTLMKCILGLYHSDTGKVEIDGNDIRYNLLFNK